MDNDAIKERVALLKTLTVGQLISGSSSAPTPAEKEAVVKVVNALGDLVTNVLCNLNDLAFCAREIEERGRHQ
jgi:hypothetical protein